MALLFRCGSGSADPNFASWRLALAVEGQSRPQTVDLLQARLGPIGKARRRVQQRVRWPRPQRGSLTWVCRLGGFAEFPESVAFLPSGSRRSVRGRPFSISVLHEIVNGDRMPSLRARLRVKIMAGAVPRW